MITVGTLFDGYLNINILLIVAIAAWAGMRLVMRLLSLSDDHALKLRMLKALVVTCFVFPALVLLFDQVARQGGTEHTYSLSLSDLVVAQYVHGGLDMTASDLDSILGLRSRFTEALLAMNSSLALGLVALLGLGLAVGLIRLGISMRHLHHILGGSFAWRRFGRVHLLLSDQVSTPFSTRGLLNRYIVLPVEMLENSKDLAIAISHELQHLRQRDTEWEVVLEFVKPLFFWNPAFTMLKRQMEQLRELGCDQRVIERKSISVKDYCECLLRTCENGMRRRDLMLRARPSVAFFQAEGTMSGINSASLLRQRMVSLMEGPRAGGSRAVFYAMTVPLLSLLGLVAVMMQKPNDWSHERLMFSTIINLDRLAARNNQ